MNFKPKQYYKEVKEKVKDAVGVIRVYFRNDDGSLGRMDASADYPHKDAILTVKEELVANGDCLTNKAVLAVINGGKQ